MYFNGQNLPTIYQCIELIFFYYTNKISAMGAEIIMYTAPSSAEVLCKF